MAELFASGRIIDVIFLFMILELIVLIIVRNKTATGVRPPELIASLGAGAALLLALRAALAQARWQVIASWLILGLIAHLCDVGFRWTTARTR